MCVHVYVYILLVFSHSVSCVYTFSPVLCGIDVVALRMVLGLSITIGCYELLRDTLARALPFWKEDSPLYVQVLT